ncbi:MAG TPA: SDR family oxidoreductase [Candidatus Nitrosopolaris rasttigaisensis]|nr:SDR family oxidoreductase [Candidatus Nitrosopolaris rasttigaisensis]
MQEKEKHSVAVVTGSSSGIGFETSLLLARSGFYTYATMRNITRSEALLDIAKKGSLPLEIIPLDVNNDNSVKEAIERIMQKFERIDVVVNNAGYGLIGALEDIPMEEIKTHFETNLFGSIRVIQSVLPIMRKQRYGTIVNVSSMGGRIAFPLSSTYSASKFALEGITESLSYEVEQFGIKVVLIEPGIVRTSFANNLKKIAKTMDTTSSPYAKLVQVREANRKSMVESRSITPDEVAKVILKAITSSNPDLRYVVGKDAAGLLESKSSMTDNEFRKFMMKNFFGGESKSKIST